MAEKSGQNIIIKKRKKGGHGAAHGGSWKVAYADFMTAMMCFFLVMWLMGSDEEIRKAIVEYFTNPNQELIKGGSDRPVNKNSRNPGNDESIMEGQQGRYEEDVLNKPARPAPVYLEEHKVLNEMVTEVFDGNAFSADVTAEQVKFSVPGNLLFQSGSTTISYEGTRYLSKLAPVFKQYSGIVSIEGHTGSAQDEGVEDKKLWELSFNRAMAVRNYLASEGVPTTKLTPVAKASQDPAVKGDDPVERQKNRRVQFILRHSRTEQ